MDELKERAGWQVANFKVSETYALERIVISKTLAWVFFCCLFMYRNGKKKLKNFGRRFHDWKLV